LTDTQFGQVVALLLLPRLTITVDANQVDLEECQGRVEEVFLRDLEWRGKTGVYYQMKEREQQLVSQGRHSPYVMEIGDLEYLKRVLTAQVDDLYAGLAPQDTVCWLNGIRWTYRGRTGDADLTVVGIPRFQHHYPLVSRTVEVWQPGVTCCCLHDELTNPAAEEGVEECRGWVATQPDRQQRALAVKRFLGRAYRPLLNA